MIDRRRLLGLGTAAAAAPLGFAGRPAPRARRSSQDQALALEDDARLGNGAGPGLGCAHHACLGPCAFDLPVPRLTGDAATRPG